MPKASNTVIPKKALNKNSVAFSKKTAEEAPASSINPSKFSASAEVDVNGRSTNAEEGLYKLLFTAVKKIYFAEQSLLTALPKMAKAAGSKGLQAAINTHLKQTKQQAVRLERVFSLLNKKPQAQKCDAFEGLLKEGEAVIESTDEGSPARDLGIIMSSQRVEHYEMVSYNGIIGLSAKIRLPKLKALLSESLEEEVETDKILAALFENGSTGNKSKTR